MGDDAASFVHRKGGGSPFQHASRRRYEGREPTSCYQKKSGARSDRFARMPKKAFNLVEALGVS
jgi:hypothetical protein